MIMTNLSSGITVLSWFSAVSVVCAVRGAFFPRWNCCLEFSATRVVAISLRPTLTPCQPSHLLHILTSSTTMQDGVELCARTSATTSGFTSRRYTTSSITTTATGTPSRRRRSTETTTVSRGTTRLPGDGWRLWWRSSPTASTSHRQSTWPPGMPCVANLRQILSSTVLG